MSKWGKCSNLSLVTFHFAFFWLQSKVGGREMASKNQTQFTLGDFAPTETRLDSDHFASLYLKWRFSFRDKKMRIMLKLLLDQ